MKLLFAFYMIALPLACSNDTTTETQDTKMVMADILLEQPSYKEETAINTIPQEQKLIKESYLRFETQDLEATFASISKIVQQYQGYIQNDVSDKSYNELSRRLVIRIPSTQFQHAIDGISKDVAYFDTKQITSKDVTEEFIDIEARLKTQKALETRYIELLNKAKTVKDIIEIERELSTIRQDIESREGRLKYLENRVGLSTLSVDFYKTTSDSGVTVSYAQKMKNALSSGFNGLSLFFLGLLHIWPFILITIIAFFLLRRWLKKRKYIK